MSMQTFKGQIRFEQVNRSAAVNGVEVWADKSDIEMEVAIAIDLDAIAKKLGPKAFKSKGKKATFMKGAVIVKQITAREIEREDDDGPAYVHDVHGRDAQRSDEFDAKLV